MKHEVKGEVLSLLPEKAMLWQDKKMLILADLHLGKITHFRKQGIPLPKEVELDNFDRFSYLILNYPIDTILILGDLFHSDYNSEWQNFLKFINQFPEKNFILVKGNHDILDPALYVGENLELHEHSLEIGPFSFTHIPEKNKLFNICGHIHPSVRLKGKGLQRLKLSCFYFKENQAILPAFGSFTGTHRLEPTTGDIIFAIGGERVIRVY